MINKGTKYSLSDYIRLLFQGFCMGIAQIIPGVSGGTIAFIFGIYEDLINAIKLIDVKLVKMVLKGQIKEAMEYFPWQFIAGLFAGMFAAIFSLSKVLKWLFQNEPILLNSFFFGLILATVPIIGKHIKKWDIPTVALGVMTTIAMYYFVGMVPVNTPDSLLFLFFCGAIAICTMILPGISGSFVLLLLGKYQYIITAVSQRDWIVLFTVGFGCVVGILLFVRFLSWLLKKYHHQTIVILTGLVVGSLRKVWPWKETLRTFVSSKGKVIPIEQINVLPAQFDKEVVFALLLFIGGFVIAFLLSLVNPEESKT